MVCLEEDKTSCIVIDKTPGSTQKRYSIVVRPNCTVKKILKNIEIQYQYDSFEVVLEPQDNHGQQIFLNDKPEKNLYEIPGFVPGTKNVLILSPCGAWLNEPIKKKIDDTKKTIKMTGKITKITKSPAKSPTPEKTFTIKKAVTPEKSISPLTIPNLIPTAPTVTTTITSTAIKNLSPLSPDPMSDDDLALGASASPTTEPDITNSIQIPIPPALPMFNPSDSIIGGGAACGNSSTSIPAIGGSSASSLVSSYSRQKYYSTPRPISGYVGLVNQAMTCYLNSLLQALFMTPEFRNALYKREFDNGKEDKIPYQLQKLFLNLQTSTKAAVETTDLTKSFGWDSTEAWQQHDIQELCRVMFDALEHKFKNTEQANLINNLYMGKMIDYVKCLECKTEKTREDSFLDIPLPVRPFGSNAAYGSIEEALRAFVQPETLDDNNQYFCEKCNKKCDAHKGLKFKNFPYILTLHLKRFDFDYQTLHRIKLNDKVTFPQNLNLNSFINATDSGTFVNLQNNNINNIIGHTNGFGENNKFDDCSTTDSGAAMEEDNSSGIATTASSSQHESELQEDDEGIDLYSNTEHRNNLSNESGAYIYELFSIMIHSGSASGGHYYAYIKEFENGEWYCFNDQTVTPITQEDIQKSFGGGSAKAYYSGVYSSSTNAYMLMYRQIDPKRNEHAIKSENFPEHIKTLLERLGTDEENKRANRHSDSDILKPKVYFYNPKLKQLKDSKVYISRDFGLESCLESAYSLLKVQPFAPISRCRLVAYDHTLNEEIHCSLEGREQEEIGDIINSLPQGIDFLLETREAEEEFEKYEINGVTLKVFLVDLNTKQLDGPYLIRAYESQKMDGLKKVIAKKLKLKSKGFTVQISNFMTGCKVFVAYCDENSTTAINETTALNLKEIVNENFARITYFYITIPTVEKQNLEILGIPPYEEQLQQRLLANNNKKLISPTTAPHQSPTHFDDGGGDVVDAVMMNGSEMNYSHIDYNSHSSSFGHTGGRSSPPLISISHSTGSGGCGGNNSTGSNSEDSSLSDGDRTLVEETHQNDSHSQISSPSHSPQLSSPEDGDIKQGCRPMLAEDIMSDDDDIIEIDPNLYFSAVQMPIDEIDSTNPTLLHGNSNSISDNEDSPKLIAEKLNKYLKVFVDERTKIGSLKRALEPHVTVPAEYFKIVRKQTDQLKLDTANGNENVLVFKEGEQLKVELGRNPRKGERKAKIHFLRNRDLNNETAKLPIVCEWIFKLGLSVIEAKRQLVAQFNRIDAKEYETLTVENCRLWEKNGRNPYKILPDDHKLGSDLRLSINCEFIIQECEHGVCTSTNEESLTLFVRRWHPSTLELDDFQEITLEKDEEIKKKLSTISGIPEDNISYTQVNNTFPCTNISLLTINSSMSWHTNTATCENYPIFSSHSGNVYFYKCSTESPKELTPDERKELSNKEKARLDRIGGGTTTSLYSPRRERALKIYLDSPPKSNRDE